jgi:hypothetical protein
MKPYHPNASELAILIILLIQRYAEERGREVSRFRLARSSLRRLAIRNRLHDVLVDEWIDAMALEYGWLVFVNDEEFCLIRAEATKTWTKIATKRCDDFIKRLREGDSSAINDAEGEIIENLNVNNGDDEED